jgi:hypothetical protein
MPADANAPNRERRNMPLVGNIRRPQIGALFWWTIAAIVLGICAVLSWFFSIYIFDNPNQPLPYRILTKLNKIEPPRQFAVESPPQGKFRSPRALYEEDYAQFEDRHLEHINSVLMRDYLENFRRSEGAIYVKGEFVVDHVRALSEDDLFQTGIVWRGHTKGFPNASVEVILPTANKTPPGLVEVGSPFALTGAFFAAVIHVAQPDDDSKCFTLVPIVYGSKQVSKGAKIALRPPPKLNLDGRWPLTSPEDIVDIPPPTEGDESEEAEEASDTGDPGETE